MGRITVQNCQHLSSQRTSFGSLTLFPADHFQQSPKFASIAIVSKEPSCTRAIVELAASQAREMRMLYLGGRELLCAEIVGIGKSSGMN